MTSDSVATRSHSHRIPTDDGHRHTGQVPATRRGTPVRFGRATSDVVGLAWVIGAAILVLLPALHHGLLLGPYDILSQSGLTHTSGVTVRNTVTGDQIDEMIPWTTLAWTEVHAGHLPLWDPFNGLGLPLAFNWQSAPFSVPALVGYMFPLRLAYTVQVVLTLIIAGTGAYVLGRVLRLGTMGCATLATIFELSGPLMGWLGWPHAAVMSWAGWLLALAILIVRGRHRVRNISLFAVIVACALYAGQPEIATMLMGSVAVVVATLLVWNMLTARSVRAAGRPLCDVAIALLAGFALGAPLVLPGLQILGRSTRNSGTLLATTEVGKALPPHDLVHLLAQGYNGLPIAGSQVFGDAVYTDTAAYIGAIAISLAVLGAVRRYRRPAVLSFLILGVITGVVVFVPPVQALILHIPLIETVDWHRILMVLGLCLAVLAGEGIDVLVRHGHGRNTQIVFAGASAACLVTVLALWAFGAGGLTPTEASIRHASLLWPLGSAAAALALAGILAWQSRKRRRILSAGLSSPANQSDQPSSLPRPSLRHHWSRPFTLRTMVCILLLAVETAFLIVSGAQLWSSSPDGVGSAPAATRLSQLVGDSTVGFGTFTCYAGPGISALGILPNANILFGVHEYDFYDPVLPKAYLRSWASTGHSQSAVPIYNEFCPVVSSASEARVYGIGYILEGPKNPGPVGGIAAGTVGGERLFRIPDSSQAMLVPVAASGSPPNNDAVGTPVSVEHTNPAEWRIVINSSNQRELRLRLTDEPGWHATIDGRPLAFEPFDDVMIQARVPAGRHVIEVRYWPTLFTTGLIMAAISATGLLIASFLAVAHRRKRR